MKLLRIIILLVLVALGAAMPQLPGLDDILKPLTGGAGKPSPAAEEAKAPCADC